MKVTVSIRCRIRVVLCLELDLVFTGSLRISFRTRVAVRYD